jgi:hypothetical protein
MIDTIDIPAVVGIALVVGFAGANLHHYYTHRYDRLYINEVRCPKCKARPGRGCVGQPYDGQRWPYTCYERWEAVDQENHRREHPRAWRAVKANRKSERRG